MSRDTRETCTHVTLLGPCFKLGEVREKIEHMLDSWVRVSQQQRWKSQQNKLVFLSVTVWERGSGQDVETRAWEGETGQPTRETTERDAEM